MDKHAMQADGARKAADPKPVETPANSAGESQGGAYPNPHSGKSDDPKWGGFFGHGGQSDIGYEGPENPNATTEAERKPG